jgi:serine/threonine protein kinase
MHELTAFASGQLPASERPAIQAHLASCATCRKALAVLLAGPDSQREQDTAPTPPAPAKPAVPLPGAPTVAVASKFPVPPDLSDHPRYEVLELIGRGGMGAVYKARHKVMNRLVALKILSPQLLCSATAIERFRREVQVAARLTHPNIVTAFDADQVGDTHFLVMEFIDGTDLANYVEKKGPLPVTYACHFIRQAALGLQHAHDRGMVHRDIKPHNLLVTPQGVVKVTDFGLARLAREAASAGGLTAENVLMGTADYIAPEQAHDPHSADIRADIYSLGCTLFHLLTGKPPFAGVNAVQKIARHLVDPIPLDELGGAPEGLRTVLARMVEKSPAQRYQKPAEAAQALMPFIKKASVVKVSPPPPAVAKDEGEPTRTGPDPDPSPGWSSLEDSPKEQPVPPPRRRRRWPLTVGIGMGAFAALVLALILLSGRTPPTSAPRLTPHFVAPGPVSMAPGEEHEVALSVIREDFNGPLTLEIDNLPAGARCLGNQPLPPWSSQWRPRLAAGTDTPPGEYALRLALRADGQVVDTQVLPLHVVAMKLPEFGDLPLVRIHPGETRLVDIPITRHGCPRQLSVVVEHPPGGIEALRGWAAPGEVRARIQLRVPPDAAAETHFLRLALMADTTRAQEGTLSLTIDPKGPEKRVVLAVRGPLAVIAGKEANLEVNIRRIGCNDKVQVEVPNLPGGVTAEPAVIPEAETRILLPIRAAKDTAVGDHKIKVLAKVGAEQLDAQGVVLQVSRPAAPIAARPPPPPPPAPEPPKPEAVRIRTGDGVDLRATFYRGLEGKKAATFLLIHDLRPGRDATAMAGLAKALQSSGHTVLLPHLRGHGPSTEVEPLLFWRFPANDLGAGKVHIGPINAANFVPNYIPWLVQDLIAARAYLDTLADEADSAVNRSNLIVIGEEEGATLACLWLATECYRFAVEVRLDLGALSGLRLAAEPEARAVPGLICLTLAPTLGGRKVPVQDWLTWAGPRLVPIVIIAGEKDMGSGEFGRRLVRTIKADARLPMLPLDVTIPGTKNTGAALLGVAPGGADTVTQQLTLLRASPLGPVNYKTTNYLWAFPSVGRLAAKLATNNSPELLPIDRIGLALDVKTDDR